MIENFVVEVDGWFAVTNGDTLSAARYKNSADAESHKNKPYIASLGKERVDIKSVSQMMKEMFTAKTAQEFVANPFGCKGIRTGRSQRREARKALKIAKREFKKRLRQQEQVQD